MNLYELFYLYLSENKFDNFPGLFLDKNDLRDLLGLADKFLSIYNFLMKRNLLIYILRVYI